MLILTRRAKEAIVINDDITIRIEEIKQDIVKISFVADKEKNQIWRKEIYDAKQRGKSTNATLK